MCLCLSCSSRAGSLMGRWSPVAAMAIQGVASHSSQCLVLPSASSQQTKSCTTWSHIGQSASSVPAWERQGAIRRPCRSLHNVCSTREEFLLAMQLSVCCERHFCDLRVSGRF